MKCRMNTITNSTSINNFKNSFCGIRNNNSNNNNSFNFSNSNNNNNNSIHNMNSISNINNNDEDLNNDDDSINENEISVISNNNSRNNTTTTTTNIIDRDIENKINIIKKYKIGASSDNNNNYKECSICNVSLSSYYYFQHVYGCALLNMIKNDIEYTPIHNSVVSLFENESLWNEKQFINNSGSINNNHHRYQQNSENKKNSYNYQQQQQQQQQQLHQLHQHIIEQNKKDLADENEVENHYNGYEGNESKKRRRDSNILNDEPINIKVEFNNHFHHRCNSGADEGEENLIDLISTTASPILVTNESKLNKLNSDSGHKHEQKKSSQVYSSKNITSFPNSLPSSTIDTNKLINVPELVNYVKTSLSAPTTPLPFCSVPYKKNKTTSTSSDDVPSSSPTTCSSSSIASSFENDAKKDQNNNHHTHPNNHINNNHRILNDQIDEIESQLYKQKLQQHLQNQQQQKLHSQPKPPLSHTNQLHQLQQHQLQILQQQHIHNQQSHSIPSPQQQHSRPQSPQQAQQVPSPQQLNSSNNQQLQRSFSLPTSPSPTTNPNNNTTHNTTNNSNSSNSNSNGVCIKGPWREDEDKMLIQLVNKYGAREWSTIAYRIQGRTGKQCRERWLNSLNPEVKKTNWTAQEDIVIIEAHTKYGNKWTKISKLLEGRTANAIKNHWNSTLRRTRSSYGVIDNINNSPTSQNSINSASDEDNEEDEDFENSNSYDD